MEVPLVEVFVESDEVGEVVVVLSEDDLVVDVVFVEVDVEGV